MRIKYTFKDKYTGVVKDFEVDITDLERLTHLADYQEFDYPEFRECITTPLIWKVVSRELVDSKDERTP